MTLHVSGLACVRGDRELFNAIDFEVAAGEALWVQGRNGCGKTSLLRLVCGLAVPAAGEVRWRGQGIRHLREDFHRELLYIGHASGIKDDLTPTENVLLGAHIAGRRERREAAGQALDRVGLWRSSHLPAGRLSQGQRKRVALARLYLQRVPPLLVLDEPFNALDQDGVEQLCAALSQHLAQGGVVVYTAHQPVQLRSARLHTLALGRARPC